ncbi:molybdenum cofactor guanylyltransferase [Desulfomarina sp.]
MELSDLPLFAVVGACGKEKDFFIRWLRTSLEENNLETLVIDESAAENERDLYSLSVRADVVLISGKTDFDLQEIKVNCHRKKKGDLCCSGMDFKSREAFLAEFLIHLDSLVYRIPLWACVLIGGKSSRMGRPKHLLPGPDGRSWLERTVETLRPFVTDIIISGAGEVPKGLSTLRRLPDAIGTVGPLAGILSATGWLPMASWILVACDMPDIQSRALAWLAGQRAAGRWGIVPRLSEDGFLEPLLACYDMRAATIFEELRQQNIMKISRVGVHPKIYNPVIPGELNGSWRNINTPEQLADMKMKGNWSQG